MRLQDLHELPKTRDSLSYLYVEHCRVDQEDKAIAIHDATGVTAVPCAALSLLMLGPGTKLTHAAALTLADCDCLVAWVGEMGVRFYAAGSGATRSARNLLHQARLATRKSTRLVVVEPRKEEIDSARDHYGAGARGLAGRTVALAAGAQGGDVRGQSFRDGARAPVATGLPGAARRGGDHDLERQHRAGVQDRVLGRN